MNVGDNKFVDRVTTFVGCLAIAVYGAIIIGGCYVIIHFLMKWW